MKISYVIATAFLLSAAALAVPFALAARSAVPAEPDAPVCSRPSVDSRLKVQMPDGPVVSVKAAKHPFELVFTNFHPDEKQTWSMSDFTFTILDKNGEQVYGSHVNHHEAGEKIVLRGKTTTVRPHLTIEVKPGEYYFVCVIGNQSGLVKFTAKE